MTAKPVETLIRPARRDLGGFPVARLLPAPQCRSVGPFVFLDVMGPVAFAAGQGLDVPPHPHIGLATVTWLIEGELLHRDSLGHVQAIRPGDVNWMTAGSGIAHSERSPQGERQDGARLHGLQAWVALPADRAEAAPAFIHYPADAIPRVISDGAVVSLIAGKGWGAESPVETMTETLYADAALAAGASLELPATPELAVLAVEGAVEIAGVPIAPGEMAVLRPATAGAVRAVTDARLAVLGGAPLDGPRKVWWNFVATTRERIERAKQDWKAGRFGAIPGESGAMDLPE